MSKKICKGHPAGMIPVQVTRTDRKPIRAGKRHRTSGRAVVAL